MANVGMDPRSSTPQEFDAYIKAQHTRWDKILAGKFQ